MVYTNEELGFILYNNRSVSSVVINFIPSNINPFKLIKIEEDFDLCKDEFNHDNRMVEINKSELNTKSEDIVVKPDDLSKLTDLFKDSIGLFTDNEYKFLLNRGISDDIIKKYKLFGLSNIKEYSDLISVGATIHPILTNILNDDIESGGIIIPLFDNGVLVNSTVRKIGIESNGVSRTLKYSQACPDVSIWFIDDINIGDDIWICEGLFDAMALREMGVKAISVSSAMWSGLQLYKLIEMRPNSITIFSDNDEVGIRSSFILKRFFNMYKIECIIVKSLKFNDPSEHYFINNLGISDIINIEEYNMDIRDESFNFLNYLKCRSF